MALVNPEELLSFPRERPLIYLYVMIWYPLLSVVPQELLYKTLFFETLQNIVPFAMGNGYRLGPILRLHAYYFGAEHFCTRGVVASIHDNNRRIAHGTYLFHNTITCACLTRTRALWMLGVHHWHGNVPAHGKCVGRIKKALSEGFLFEVYCKKINEIISQQRRVLRRVQPRLRRYALERIR